jgi:hypothetical protein
VTRFGSEGFELRPTGPEGPDPARRLPLRELDPKREDSVLRRGFAEVVARERTEALAHALDSWKPDVVVSDEVDFGAMLAAENAGIPRAVVLVIASGIFIRRELLAEPLGLLRSELGLPSDPHLTTLDGDLVLSPFPPTFRDPNTALASAVSYFRAIADENSDDGGYLASWPEYRNDRLTVHVTLGTDFNVESGDLFSRILSGIRNMPLNIVVTVGHQIHPDELGQQPPNVRIERYVPQSILLPHCDVVVSHGESGSILGALSYGTPLVNFPMGADQPMNADRCAELGVGISLDALGATSEEIGGTVRAVLEQPSFRLAAGHLRDEIASLAAPADIVPELERLANR